MDRYQLISLIPTIAVAGGLLIVFINRIFDSIRMAIVNHILALCLMATIGHAVFALVATRTNLKRAEIARTARDGAALIHEANEALRIDPNSAAAYVARAEGYAIKGDCRQALVDVGKAMEISNGLSGAYLVRGNCHVDSGDEAAAIVDFTRAIDRDSRCWQAYTDRAQSFLAMGDRTTALTDIDNAIRLNPDYPALFLLRAQIYMGKNNQAALSDFRSAEATSDNQLRVFALLGQAQILMDIKGKESSALEKSDEAVRLAPTIPLAYLIRGNTFRALRMYPNALDDYAKAIAIDSSFLGAYMERAQLYLLIGNIKAALDDLNMAVQLSPDFVPAYTLRVEVLTRLGEREQAATDLRTVTRLLSSQPRYRSFASQNQGHRLPII